MKMTSAIANKLLKQLNNELNYAYQQEARDNTYIQISGEDPIVPDYDIAKTRGTIEAIQDRIVRIKHALNTFNTNTVVPGTNMTIDQLLVKMSMLNREKTQLETMRNMPKKRVRQTIRCTSSLPEYDVANFDPNAAAALYDAKVKEIADLQLALDAVNSSEAYAFEVDLED